MQTYGELKSAIANWIDRLDLTAEIPEFIRLAEGDIFRDLRCKQNEFTAEYTSTSWSINGVNQGAPTLGIHKTLPQNFKEMKLVSWDSRPLGEVSEQNMRLRLLNNSDPEPVKFAQVVRQMLFSQDIPDDLSTWESTSTLIYTYYGVESLNSFPTWQTAANPVDKPAVEDLAPENIAQSDSNTTRLLQHYPDLYLAGAMVWAHRFLRDPEKAMEWKATFDEQRGLLGVEEGELTGSTVQVTGIYGD